MLTLDISEQALLMGVLVSLFFAPELRNVSQRLYILIIIAHGILLHNLASLTSHFQRCESSARTKRRVVGLSGYTVLSATPTPDVNSSTSTRTTKWKHFPVEIKLYFPSDKGQKRRPEHLGAPVPGSSPADHKK